MRTIKFHHDGKVIKIVKIYKNQNDQINKDEVIIDVEVDGKIITIKSDYQGIITKIISENEVLEKNKVIALIELNDEKYLKHRKWMNAIKIIIILVLLAITITLMVITLQKVF